MKEVRHLAPHPGEQAAWFGVLGGCVSSVASVFEDLIRLLNSHSRNVSFRR
jgi:hypothetical protein